MDGREDASAEAARILDRLGWAPASIEIEGVEWAWTARPTQDVLVRVLRPEGSPIVHVETTTRFFGEDARRLADGAPISSQVKLHLLAASLEYDFHDDGDGRAVTVADYVDADDLTVASLGTAVRRVKDAHYATLVILQAGAPSREPRSPTEATLTTLAVAPETWALLQQALVPGQTVDELIRDLLAREPATP